MREHPVPGIMTRGSILASISAASRSRRSSRLSEFASLLVPNTARPQFCETSQRQWRMRRPASTPRSALKGVTTGESRPRMRGALLVSLTLGAAAVAVSGISSSVACRRHSSKTVDIYLLVRHSGQANHRTCDDLRDPESMAGAVLTQPWIPDSKARDREKLGFSRARLSFRNDAELECPQAYHETAQP